MIELLGSSTGFCIFSLWSSTLSLLKENTSYLFANVCGVVSNPEISETGLKFGIDANRSPSHQSLDNRVTVSLFSVHFLAVDF